MKKKKRLSTWLVVLLIAAIGGGPEQVAEHRHLAEPRHALARRRAARLQQAGDDEALTVPELQRRIGAPHLEAGDGDVVDGDGGRIVDLAHLRLDVEVNETVGSNRRREVEADAELLELDGNRIVVAGHRYRKLATGEEAGRLAGQCHKIGLGQ